MRSFLQQAGPTAGRWLIAVAAFSTGLASSLDQADAVTDAAIEAIVTDAGGAPLDRAVVWATPMSGQRIPDGPAAEAVMEQRDKAFGPDVLPVRAGTAVRFPNHDTVRHHVYSFSPAKVFSLKLYIGTPPEPVVFDKAGEVVLGCNIHDQMVAWVIALDTPWFGRTGSDGRVRMAALVPGEYDVRVWHPQQTEPVVPVRVRVGGDGRPVTVPMRAAIRAGSGPAPAATANRG